MKDLLSSLSAKAIVRRGPMVASSILIAGCGWFAAVSVFSAPASAFTSVY